MASATIISVANGPLVNNNIQHINRNNHYTGGASDFMEVNAHDASLLTLEYINQTQFKIKLYHVNMYAFMPFGSIGQYYSFGFSYVSQGEIFTKDSRSSEDHMFGIFNLKASNGLWLYVKEFSDSKVVGLNNNKPADIVCASSSSKTDFFQKVVTW